MLNTDWLVSQFSIYFLNKYSLATKINIIINEIIVAMETKEDDE